MKIGVFQDIHANLPAFNKAIEFFKANQCSKIFHVGDLIGIGPHPKEVFYAAIAIPELTFIMGNHDYWYGYGLPNPKPAWMSDDEVEHQKWVHSQIGEGYRKEVKNWKFVETLNLKNNRAIIFQHYGYDEKTNWFKSFVKEPDSDRLDILFDGIKGEMVFYGHHHEASDITGNCRYVNLGSAGCFTKSKVRLGILEIQDNALNLEKHSIFYNDRGLMEDYEIRKVPARKFITNNFISRD